MRSALNAHGRPLKVERQSCDEFCAVVPRFGFGGSLNHAPTFWLPFTCVLKEGL